jgi:DNA-directed RNA polymerase subunit RPC12/RpoP
VSEQPCPHCGEPVEPRQLVCLNCGGRIALKERTPLAREPVTAIAAVLLVTVVVGAGLFGFAISELTSDERTRVETVERVRTVAEPQAPAVVDGETQATEQQPARRDRRVPGWPEGLTAHTVVLVTSSDRPAALNVARQARSSGLEAGMMPSDPYDLGTGLWIVYSGRFTTREGAQRQAAQLADRYPGAYPQLVQSSQ